MSKEEQELYDQILESRDQIGELEFSQQSKVLSSYYMRGTEAARTKPDQSDNSDEESATGRRKSSGASSGKGVVKSKIGSRMARLMNKMNQPRFSTESRKSSIDDDSSSCSHSQLSTNKQNARASF